MSINRLQDRKLIEIYKFISSVNKTAFRNNYLLSNQILSKNPFTSNFIDIYVNEEQIEIPSFRYVIRYLGRYYRYSFKEYFEYVKRKLTWLKSGQIFFLNKETEKLVLIDTFILCNRINDKKTFTDSYFDELIVVLNKLKKSYAYLPVFINSKSLDKFNNILEIIKKERVNVLTEYQLLSFTDYFHILIFILVYPFHVIKLAYSIPLSSYISKVFRSEILSTLTQVTFLSYGINKQSKKGLHTPWS